MKARDFFGLTDINLIEKLLVKNNCKRLSQITGKHSHNIEATCRHVFQINDKQVIKFLIDSTPNGYRDQNEVEVKVWNKFCCTKYAKYLAQIYWYCPKYSWIIQEFIPVTNSFGETDKFAYEKVTPTVLEAIKYIGIDDVHKWNFGYKNNKIIIFDYGLTRDGEIPI